MRDIISESIRYWEPRRIVYNLVLALVVLYVAATHWSSFSALTRHPIAGLICMAAAANVLYCTAYVVDLFVQMSNFQKVWKRYRWVVLAAGTILAVTVFLATRD